ncbi:MAG: hypothetical protein ACSLFH_08125, partial [Desulfuromonadales bacterium]
MSQNDLFGGDGLWYRAEQYALDDGVIVPAGPARAYDPWAHFDMWRKEEQGVDAPYARLINLLNELVFSPGKFANVYEDLISRSPRALERFEKSEMATAILDCCSETGLLGVLPRRITAFRSDVEGKTGGAYQWTPSGWSRVKELMGEGIVAAEGVKVIGELRSPLVDFFSEEGVEVVGYPPPLSPPFWSCYQEPVVDFVSEAINLLKILRGLFDIFSDEDQVSQSREDLNAFLISAKPILVKNDQGELACRWVTPSLLDTYAVMIAMDALMEPRRIALCSNCGKLFSPTGKKTLFCDDKCRNTGNKKLARKRQATAKEWANSGMPVEEIAEKLNSDI